MADEQVVAGSQTPAAKVVPAWQSKTLWVAALTAIVPLIPGIGPVVTGLVTTNPELASALVGALFATLRLVSHGKVTVKPS